MTMQKTPSVGQGPCLEQRASMLEGLGEILALEPRPWEPLGWGLLFFVTLFISFVPLLNVVVTPLVPLPIALAFVRLGGRSGALLIAALGVLLVTLFPALIQLHAAPFLVSGAVLGWMSARGSTPGKILAVGTLALGMVFLGLFLGYNTLAHVDPGLPTTGEAIREFYDTDLQIERLKKLPDSTSAYLFDGLVLLTTGHRLDDLLSSPSRSEEISLLRQQNAESKTLMLKVNQFPLALFGVVAFVLFGASLVAFLWIGRGLGLLAPATGGMALWRIPWWVAWFPILGFGLQSLFSVLEWPYPVFVAKSLLVLALLPYVVLAFAILSFYSERLQMDPLISTVVHVFVLMNIKVFAVLAVFDSWFDFRRLDKQGEDSPEKDAWDDLDF